jgi:hypothetical protein
VREVVKDTRTSWWCQHASSASTCRPAFAAARRKAPLTDWTMDRSATSQLQHGEPRSAPSTLTSLTPTTSIGLTMDTLNIPHDTPHSLDAAEARVTLNQRAASAHRQLRATDAAVQTYARSLSKQAHSHSPRLARPPDPIPTAPAVAILAPTAGRAGRRLARWPRVAARALGLRAVGRLLPERTFPSPSHG